MYSKIILGLSIFVLLGVEPLGAQAVSPNPIMEADDAAPSLVGAGEDGAGEWDVQPAAGAAEVEHPRYAGSARRIRRSAIVITNGAGGSTLIRSYQRRHRDSQQRR